MRGDSHLPHREFDVSPQRVIDIQLIEQASSRSLWPSKKYLSGLTKRMDVDGGVIGPAVVPEWKAAREDTHRLPKGLGSEEVYTSRPLLEKTRRYCVGDFQSLPQLWEHYQSRGNLPMNIYQSKLAEQTRNRVSQPRSQNIKAEGKSSSLVLRATNVMSTLWLGDSPDRSSLRAAVSMICLSLQSKSHAGKEMNDKIDCTF